MDVVIRPVNDRFLKEVVFPAFEAGVTDASAGLGLLEGALRDERALLLVDILSQNRPSGGLLALEENSWLELAYRLLFSKWSEEGGGWRVSAEYSGYAGGRDQALHLTLMLEEPHYPYGDVQKARELRGVFVKDPDSENGLSALVCGLWDPFPEFRPDQVLSTSGTAVYVKKDKLAVADWTWRSAQTVSDWSAQLPGKLSRLLARETKRLYPVEVPETREVVDYWLGKSDSPPILAVSFSGLGRDASGWIREIGAIARTVRAAAAAHQGLTAIVTRPGRSMADASGDEPSPQRGRR